jgi:hypothetical protein
MRLRQETLRAVHSLLNEPRAQELWNLLDARLAMLANQIDRAKSDRTTNELRGERMGIKWVKMLPDHIAKLASDVKMNLEEDE